MSKEGAGAGSRRRVLITGASGRIGTALARALHERYTLRLMVQARDAQAEAIAPYGEVLVADLADLPRLKEVCRDVDTVVHLAANASASTVWRDLLHNNIIGTYHICAAAKAAGCRRLIFASSVHAVSGYPPDVQVKTSEPVNPGDLYGVSKVFGEALGRYMAEQEGLSVIALRIGAYQPSEAAQRADGLWMADCFISPRDLHQLIERCIEAEQVRFAIFHAISDNRFKRLDISDARELVGYQPQDDFTALHPALASLRLHEVIYTHNLSADPTQRSGMREEL
jgi:nucleoside-diphosphate-sugar epimerase